MQAKDFSKQKGSTCIHTAKFFSLPQQEAVASKLPVGTDPGPQPARALPGRSFVDVGQSWEGAHQHRGGTDSHTQLPHRGLISLQT